MRDRQQKPSPCKRHTPTDRIQRSRPPIRRPMGQGKSRRQWRELPNPNPWRDSFEDLLAKQCWFRERARPVAHRLDMHVPRQWCAHRERRPLSTDQRCKALLARATPSTQTAPSLRATPPASPPARVEVTRRGRLQRLGHAADVWFAGLMQSSAPEATECSPAGRNPCISEWHRSAAS